ncbi:2-acylglycerol O-acyltransferase 2-B-like [Crotalus adamanteus]|uniref:diacylglycerol O-acyltransferase n=1 Tax=Crotalus adamanteus TaxID=8729 RepID=A0AAW1B220_CROAD
MLTWKAEEPSAAWGLYLVLLLGDSWLLALGYTAWLYLDWEMLSRGSAAGPSGDTSGTISLSQAVLVPVFSFRENELFNQVSNPQDFAMGLALPLFHAWGIFQYSFGLLPFRSPIYTIIGAPIMVLKMPHLSREAIDELHETYLEKLTQLFEEHKAKYGLPQDKHLMIT